MLDYVSTSPGAYRRFIIWFTAPSICSIWSHTSIDTNSCRGMASCDGGGKSQVAWGDAEHGRSKPPGRVRPVFPTDNRHLRKQHRRGVGPFSNPPAGAVPMNASRFHRRATQPAPSRHLVLIRRAGARQARRVVAVWAWGGRYVM